MLQGPDVRRGAAARTISRRSLLRRLGAASLGAQFMPIGALTRTAHAALPPLRHPVLVHLMCVGGPDFRHLLPPAYDADPSSYGHQFYRARAATLGVPSTPAGYAAAWNERYVHASGPGGEFGVLRGCEWLLDFWQQGHAGLVHNVVASTSRDHSHSQLVWESADRGLPQVGRALTGWGGRLADAANSSVLSLTATPRTFCFSRNSDDPGIPGTRRIVTLSNPATVGLYEPGSGAPRGARSISRALSQYYAGLDGRVPASSPYRVFVDHEQQLRSLGSRLRPLFDALPMPAPLAALRHGPVALAHADLAAQAQALYHALAVQDEIDFHSISMAFGGFDTHDMQREELEPRFRDLFGRGGALDALYRVLPPTVSERLVFMISGEFGRQLRSNGDTGTDHGQGNTVLLLGYPVRGGHYGVQFPTEELDRLDEASPDIRGRTHLDAVLAEIVEFLHPNVAGSVLPGRGSAATEPGVSLANLFR
jgi:uncharacterized protein (DUF1501 family)